MAKVSMSDFISKYFKVEDFSHLHWSGNLQQYVDMVSENPKIARNSFQRIHDMILSFGTSK